MSSSSQGKGPPPTRHGHPMDEAASALQKSIRRSDQERALYWARELLENHPHYLWTRIATCCSEDVGLAVPWMPAQIAALRQMWLENSKRKNGGDGFMWAAHAVLLLARAPKSRLVDDMMLVVADVPQELPDWALDRHTRRGRALGRTWTHFWEEGALLADPETGEVNKEAIENPYAERARRAPGFCDARPGDVAVQVEQLREEQAEQMRLKEER